jgi:diguanylate cyclase (GGDEF)-like protein/PAS domain S-box-containing protein
LRSTLTRFWRFITEPVPGVEGLERRQTSKLLAGTLAVFIVLGLAAATVQLYLVPGFITSYIITLVILAFLTFSWLMARNGAYESGVWISIVVIIVGCITMAAIDTNVPAALFYPLMAVLLASMFLSLGNILITGVVSVAAVVALLIVEPSRAPEGDLLLVPVFLIICSVAIWFARRHHDHLEAIRQHQLKLSEERYQVAVGAAKEGIWEYDLINQKIHLSPQALAILGFSEGNYPTDSSDWAERIPPDDLATITGSMQDLVEGRASEYDVTHRILASNNKTLWVKSRGRLVSDEKDQPAKVIGTFGDVTEEQKANELAYLREENLRQAQAIAHIGSWTWDLETGETSWSDEMFRIYGVDRQKFEANAWSIIDQLTHPDDRERVRTITEDAVKNNAPISITYRVIREDGEERVLHGEGDLILDAHGKPVKRIGTVQDVSELRAAEEALRDERNFANAIMESANSLMVVLDSTGRIVRFNPTCESVTGYSADEVQGRFVWEFLLIPEEREPVKQVFEALTADALSSRFQNYWLDKDGSRHLIDWANSVISDQSGKVLYVVSIGTDITERQKAEADMVKHAHALEQTADAVIITDRRGIIEYVNPAFEAATGFSRAEAIGQTPRIVKSGQHDLDFYRNLWETILGGGVFRDVFVNRAKDGHIYYEEKTITPLLDSDGVITHFVSSGKDITERMETQERLYYLAHHDALTDLPNRVMFLDRLKHVATRLLRRNQICAVLFLDLDRFKNINDTLGHDTGDKLLQAVGDRLKESVRAGDTVARLGGDEFTVLLEDIESADDIAPIARKILKSLTEPFHVEEHELFTSASIGISLCPGDGTDPNTLLKNADTAMYRAKDQGRNNFQFYSAEMGARALEHLTMETGLRHALERNEFELYFQPQFRMQDNSVIGAEVLLRWQHPALGLISPNEFVPLLEDTGLIVSVGHWVLRTVCQQLNAWQDEGRSIPRVSINLSGRQFDELDFLDSVLDIIHQEKIRPSIFEFEITESLLLKRAQYTVDVLEQFSRQGIRIALDDFGTGYSSLSYLKRFPINTIKIDRSFVRDVPDDQEDAEIVKAILAMARSLNINVVAEGVETTMQEDFLRAAGCEMLQGYLHGKPMPVEEFGTRFLAKGKSPAVSS